MTILVPLVLSNPTITRMALTTKIIVHATHLILKCSKSIIHNFENIGLKPRDRRKCLKQVTLIIITLRRK